VRVYLRHLSLLYVDLGTGLAMAMAAGLFMVWACPILVLPAVLVGWFVSRAVMWFLMPILELLLDDWQASSSAPDTRR
jgi:hypothetical protein